MAIPDARIAVLTGHHGARLLDHQKRKKRLMELVVAHTPAGGRLLDVGCGNGDIGIELAQKGFCVTGLDQDVDRIRRGNALADELGVSIDLKVGDAGHLPDDKPFDLILLGEIIEHFDRPETFLDSLDPLLKPEGRLLVSTPNMPTIRNRLKFGIFGVFPDNFLQHRSYFDGRRFREMLDRTAWRIEFFETRFAKMAESPPAFWAIIDRTVMQMLSWLVPGSGSTIISVLTRKQQKPVSTPDQ